jgi:YVTN family beta-propeller protein
MDMRNRGEGTKHVRPIALIIIMTAAFAAAGAPAFVPLEGSAQARDAVLDLSGQTLYLAIYDQGQVRVVDTATGQESAQIAVEQGPCALAVSMDGKTLACANRLSNTVTLVRLPEGAPYASLPTGEGPSDIAALPDGRFVLANTYSDSITLVDPAGDGRAETLVEAIPVPTGLAVSGQYAAVISRAEPTLYLLSVGLDGAPETVALDGIPTSVAVAGENRFVVSTPAGLAVVAADEKRVEERRSGNYREVVADENRLYALKGGALEVLDRKLAPHGEWTLPGNSQRAVVRGDICVALAPAARQIFLRCSPESAAMQAAMPAPGENPPPPTLSVPPPVTEPPATPAVVEARDTAIPVEPPPLPPAPSATQVQEPASEPVPAADSADALSNPSPAPPDQAGTEPATSPPANPAPPQPAAERTPPGGVRRFPPASEVRAPSPGRPSVLPVGDLSRKTISDALREPTELGAPGAGFVAPDWTQPFRDIQAGRMHQDLDSGRTELHENVHLRLGDMYFRADEFSYTEDAGSIHAIGNVDISQQSSRITAQEIQFEAPAPEAVAPPSVFAAPLGDQELAKRRLTLGRVLAQHVHISEPTRELIAENIDYDFANEKGELINARGKAGIYYFSAQKLRILGPESMEAEDAWVTTCDHDPPHYRIRMKELTIKDGVASSGTNLRLQLGRASTPLFLPVWRQSSNKEQPWSMDFDSGRQAAIGSFINVGQRFEITPDIALGPRIMPTEKEGIGIGADLDYDFMRNPASRLYRTKGEVHGLYTTENRGYLHLQHRFDPSRDLTVKVQAEHWGDRDFYKDFFYKEYRDRTTPRTFANVAYRQPGYVATGTVRVGTHGWVRETERLPEGTFHLIERPLTNNLYVTFDTIDGYNRREPSGEDAVRSVNVARLSYDWDPAPALNVTPFVETQLAWYSEQRGEGGSTGRVSSTLGTTLQTRLHREYEGFWGFSAFKHVVLPSLTYTYNPGSSMDVEDTPHFDALDVAWGRSRIETKIDNVIYGRDAQTGEVWQVGRLTLYQGNDFWNETRKSDDYEIEMDVRPRPWWGWQLVGERHVINDDLNLDSPYALQQGFYEWYDRAFGRPFNTDWMYDFNASYGDYSRILTQLYYDDTLIGGRLNGRLGFAYTETQNRIFNRDVLFGMGYKLGEKWGVGFEHVYDFERDRLRSQMYEIRRNLHCWEAAIRLRERESGTDINIEFNITAFPGSRFKF